MNAKRMICRIGLMLGVFIAAAEAATIPVTTTNDSGAGSLRQAITTANLSTNVSDIITFGIGAGRQTITPATALPAITDAATIDGYTQSGSSSNTLANGDNAVINIVVLGTIVIDTSNSTVRGLALHGIDIGAAPSAKGGNVVEGNFIGLDGTGTNSFNASRGVFVQTPNNRVGGTLPGARNIISGHVNTGIEIFEAFATNNTVQGNYVGTDLTGTKAIGNGDRAVVVNANAHHNTIGGTNSGARNVISGNLDRGLTLDGATNVVQGNYIGTDVTGANPLGNARTGIEIGGPGNSIGGTNAGAVNVIAFNGVNGGGVFTTNGVDVKVGTVSYRIFSNSIFDNMGLGIDVPPLGATTAGFPVLNLASNATAATVIKGTFSPSTTFVLELFSNPTADPSGFGEGKTLLVSSNVTTDAGGNFTVNLPLLAPGLFVTATGNGTSEFSQARMVITAGSTNSWTNSVSGKWEVGSNWSLGSPPYLGFSANLITNANTKTVTIDATTSGSFPTTMSISNLTIGAPAGSTNTLLLSNAGTSTPLRILRNCILTNGSALIISNASVQVPSNQLFNVDGAVTLLEGSLVASNSNLTTRFGNVGRGSFAMASGNAFFNYPIVGLGSGALGEFTVAGGTATVASVMDLGDSLTATGSVWVTGGRLDVTGTIYDGLSGAGRLTISNGTLRAGIIGVAFLDGSRATFTAAGGTTIMTSFLLVAEGTASTGSVFVTGGTVVMTNLASNVGQSGIADMTVSSGSVLASQMFLARNPGSSATLTVAGGTMVVSSLTSTGSAFGATSTVWVTGGQLTLTNNFILFIGPTAVGGMTVSNGTVNLNVVSINAASPSAALRVAGGAVNIGSEFSLEGANPAVWLTGGQITATNDFTGVGQLVISNGVYLGRDMYVGFGNRGTVTVAGGRLASSGYVSALNIGYNATTGTVWVTGGQLVFTNTNISVGGEASPAFGSLIVSNGSLQASNVLVAAVSGGRGTFTCAGGTNSVYANLILGDGSCIGTGFVNVTGGRLLVTNAAGNATLDVRSGTFTISGGLLQADKIVITNPCAHFVISGGAVLYTTAVLPANGDIDGDGIPNSYELSHGLNALDPANAFGDTDGDGLTDLEEYLAGTDPTNSLSALRVTSILRTNSNMRITWATAGGHTNRVLIATPVPDGSFTNEFSNLSPILIIPGTGDTSTNYTHIGGATNSPSNFYRIRLIP